MNVLSEWSLSHIAEDAVLVVSELMTNALEASLALPHTPPIALRLLRSRKQLVIEAWDHSPQDLQQRQATADEEGGRGLMVVEALSTRWGVRRTGYASKVVWAELPIPTVNTPRMHITPERDPDVLARVHRGLTNL